MTVPLTVSTEWDIDSFDPGAGLPVITKSGVQITDQTTLNNVLLAAGKARVELRFAPPAGAAGLAALRHLRLDGDQGNTAAQQLRGRQNLGIDVAGAITDGQPVVWSATLGQFVAANPTGASELAAAINVTAATQTIVGVANTISAVATITGTTITVPASGGRSVTFHYGAAIAQSVAGDGSWYLNIQETTSGNVTIGGKAVRLPNSTAASTDALGIDGEFPIGVVAAPRTFRLIGFLWCPAANTPQVLVQNAVTTPSYLRAVAG